MSELKVGDTVLVPATVEYETPGSVQLRLPGTHGTLGYDKSVVAAWNTRATPPLMQVTEGVGESVSEADAETLKNLMGAQTLDMAYDLMEHSVASKLRAGLTEQWGYKKTEYDTGFSSRLPPHS